MQSMFDQLDTMDKLFNRGSICPVHGIVPLRIVIKFESLKELAILILVHICHIFVLTKQKRMLIFNIKTLCKEAQFNILRRRKH